MRRKAEYPIEKVTLNLRKGDFARLRELHGRLGASAVVRKLVIDHIARVEEIVAQRTGTPDFLGLEEIENDQGAS